MKSVGLRRTVVVLLWAYALQFVFGLDVGVLVFGLIRKRILLAPSVADTAESSNSI
ncbi:MAG TPA: hypothetical protein VIJ18_02790 [Microbacteriaceae bacterium]